ncbi:MAG: DUF2505 domain-containing protein [Nocardioidaceae bacterium]
MRFRHEMPYDASPAKVYAMLADPGFREASCKAQDVVSVDASVTPTSTGMSVRIDQEQQTPGLPSFARKFIGATTHALQLEEWSDHRNATLEIRTSTPGTMKGSIVIEPVGKGAREVVELDISVGLPLVGGKLEKLMADLVRRSIETEHRTGQAWLAGERA